MTDREIMQQALDALEETSGGYSQNIISALRSRLAQPEQEPVAHYLLAALQSVLPELESVGPLDKFERARAAIALFERLAQPEQPAKIDIDYWVSSRTQIIEALAKAGFTLMSNANGFWLQPAPQPEQEPGTLRIDRLNQWLDVSLKDRKPAREQPAQRKPLTDEEIGKIAGETLDPWSCARVIEAAHGIKENT